MASSTTSAQTDWREEWFEFEDATYLNLAGQSPLPGYTVKNGTLTSATGTAGALTHG